MKNNKYLKTICLALSTLLLIGVFAACTSAKPKSGNSSAVKANDLMYINLRINPEIELIADENQTVVAANPINEDGEVVLAELPLVGETVAEAGEAFTDKAAELGYLDTSSEDATVNIGVDGEDSEAVEKIEKSITDRINRYFKNNGIFGKVSKETLEKHAPEADTWNVSVGHAKTIIRILDLYPEMTSEEVLALSVQERMRLIRDCKKNNGAMPSIKSEYKEKVGELKDKYASLFELRKEIDGLEDKLADDNADIKLTDEERAALETQLAEKKAMLDEPHAAYKEELNTLKQEFKKKAEEQKTLIKEEYETRREAQKETASAPQNGTGSANKEAFGGNRGSSKGNGKRLQSAVKPESTVTSVVSEETEQTGEVVTPEE